MPRPTELTPEVHRLIVQGILLGATYELAAGYGGVTYDTFNNWMKRGKREKSGIFFELFKAVEQAKGKAAIQWLAKIEAAANDGAWQAAAWKLERRYPGEYGRTVIDQRHSGSIGTYEVDIGSGDDDSTA